MGIFTFLASLGLFISMDFYRSYSFRTQSASLVSTLKRARSQAMGNINGTPHGVKIATTSYTLFQGASYGVDPSYDQTFALDGGVTRAGLGEVVFTQLTGESNASGSIQLTEGIHTATISLNYEGRISW
jgi:hypothetical protein